MMAFNASASSITWRSTLSRWNCPKLDLRPSLYQLCTNRPFHASRHNSSILIHPRHQNVSHNWSPARRFPHVQMGFASEATFDSSEQPFSRDVQIGFIGAGYMASAMVQGLVSSRLVDPDQCIVCDKNESKLDAFRDMGTQTRIKGLQVVESSDIVILAVKPFAAEAAIREVTAALGPDKLLISVCAGISIKSMRKWITDEKRGVSAKLNPASAASKSDPDQKQLPQIVRVMPNTPCLVGEGITAFVLDPAIDDDLEEGYEQTVRSIFGALGKVFKVPEDKMDIVTGLCGSGPAYVYTFIEVLADSAVFHGIDRNTARAMASQLVFGSAKMVIENSTTHTAELRNRVESAGGTTIQGSMALEKHGFRAAIHEAVIAATKRARDIAG